MTLQEASQLHKGDKIFWTDPDQGLCSKFIVVNSISIELDSGTVIITDDQGVDLQCFPEELS